MTVMKSGNIFGRKCLRDHYQCLKKHCLRDFVAIAIEFLSTASIKPTLLSLQAKGFKCQVIGGSGGGKYASVYKSRYEKLYFEFFQL